MSARNYVELVDITGVRWRSDTATEEWSADERAQIADLFGNFTDLTHISLEIDGAKHYFNPAHVISLAIKEESS